MASHGTQDMFPTFLERQWDFGSWQKTIVTMVSMVGAIAGGIFDGFSSDRVGRRRAIMIAMASALVVVPLWALPHSIGFLYLGAFLLQFCVQGAWGVVPAYVAELSPREVRAFVPGLANQFGVVLASSIVYVESCAAHRIAYAYAMALSAAFVFVLVIMVSIFAPERIATDLSHD